MGKSEEIPSIENDRDSVIDTTLRGETVMMWGVGNTERAKRRRGFAEENSDAKFKGTQASWGRRWKPGISRGEGSSPLGGKGV